MKNFKKAITTGVLLSTLALPIMAKAANVTVSVGNGSFSSYASYDALGANTKSVTGISTAKSNIGSVTSKAASSVTVVGKSSARSYCGGLSLQSRYTVTNTGTTINGTYKAHNQSV